MPSTTIYQRTQTGRDEIYNKQAGLTQSERQILIVIDGVTPYDGIRGKLAALSHERFDRAVRALLKKEMISEVFLPMPGQEADRIETAVVDRFLQQEPTDPVTIISYDLEEEFGDFPPQLTEALTAPIPELDVIVAPVPAVDEVHARMVDSLQEELQARKTERRYQTIPQQISPASRLPASNELPTVKSEHTQGVGLHWGYWLIGLGVACIVAFLLAKLVDH